MTRKIFITKYAITKDGEILEFDVDEKEIEGNSVRIKLPNNLFSTGFKIGRDAFFSREEAATAAGVERDKKIKRLEKQIAELRVKTF